MNLKNVALQLCTCTWIEIMTCIGIALYLVYLQSYYLTILTIVVFSPLIGFHFAIDRLSGDKIEWKRSRSRIVKIRPSKNKLVD